MKRAEHIHSRGKPCQASVLEQYDELDDRTLDEIGMMD